MYLLSCDAIRQVQTSLTDKIPTSHYNECFCDGKYCHLEWKVSPVI